MDDRSRFKTVDSDVADIQIAKRPINLQNFNKTQQIGAAVTRPDTKSGSRG